MIYAIEVAIALTLAAVYALNAAAGVVVGRHPLRQALAWAFSVAGLVAVATAPIDLGLVRFFLATGAGTFTLHLLDLIRGPQLTRRHRVWHMTTPTDTRLITRVAPELSARSVVVVAAYGGASALAVTALIELPPATSLASYGARWLSGLVAFYCAFEVMDRLFIIGYRAAGYAVRPLQNQPALSRSVQEFWGVRWNAEINRLLRSHIFRPIARRRWPRLGLVAAFAGSTLLHVWIMMVSAGVEQAAVWAVFFMIQGGFIIGERALHIDRWRAPVAHAWTIVLMVGSSPLFVEPVIQVLLADVRG